MNVTMLQSADLAALKAMLLKTRRAQTTFLLAQVEQDELLLSIEKRYDLVGKQAEIDAQTGAITVPEAPKEPG